MSVIAGRNVKSVLEFEGAVYVEEFEHELFHQLGRGNDVEVDELEGQIGVLGLIIGSESSQEVGDRSAREQHARQVMAEVYRPLYLSQAPILYTGLRAAELIKYDDPIWMLEILDRRAFTQKFGV